MKVMTFNIWNYTRPWPERRERIAALVRDHRPDVVCLQETRHDFRFEGGKGQGDQLADLTGYRATFMLGQVYLPVFRVDEGVTTLTRDKPIAVKRLELTVNRRERDDQNQRVCLGVTVSSGNREIDVYNTHWSLSARARERNALEVARFIANQSGDRPALIMGDLNAEPETLPIRFMVGEARIDDLSADFVDCWSAVHPDDPGFTYASFGPVRRIDYVLGRNLPLGVRSAVVVGGEAEHGVHASDHMGIVVDIEV